MSIVLTIAGSHAPAEGRALGLGTKSMTITQSGDARGSDQVELGTVEESFTLPADLGTVRWIFIENLDTTNFVSLGFTTLVLPIVIQPGQATLIPLNAAGQQIFGQADTAAARIQWTAYGA